MLISHAYRFIFIKTQKTGGTSLEIALSRFLGADDVITPISPQDEMRRRALEYRGPQNYSVPAAELAPYARARQFLASVTGREWKRGIRFYNHMAASEIRQRVGDEVWRSYTKFCIERSPWTKVISAFWWLVGTNARAFAQVVAAQEEQGI